MEFIVPTEADKSREAIAESIEKLTSQITLDVNQLKTAIEATNSSNCWEIASSFGACLTAFLTICILFYELIKWRQERNRTLGLDLLRQIQEQHHNVVTTLAPSSQITNKREAWQSVYDQLKCLKPLDQIKDEAIKKEAEQHRAKFKEDLGKYLRDSDPEKESLRWQFFTGYEYWKNCEADWETLKPNLIINSTSSQPDQFGNYPKKNFTDIDPYIVIATFQFAHTGLLPEREDIEIREVSKFNPKEQISRQSPQIIFEIQKEQPEWAKSQPPLGLLYFIGCKKNTSQD